MDEKHLKSPSKYTRVIFRREFGAWKVHSVYCGLDEKLVNLPLTFSAEEVAQFEATEHSIDL